MFGAGGLKLTRGMPEKHIPYLLEYKSHPDFRVKNWYKIVLSPFYIPSKSEQ